eukprot:13950538-Alexandrium_andersonii.AAC.1
MNIFLRAERAMWWCALGSTYHGMVGRCSMSFRMLWSCCGTGVVRGVVSGGRRLGRGRMCARG